MRAVKSRVVRASRSCCKAQRIDGKASSPHGISSQRKSPTSRLSGPAETCFVEQASAIDQLHLADPRDVVNGEQALDLDPRPRLFPGLALGSGASRLVQFEIARGQGPKAVARLDRAADQQDALTRAGDRADDDLRVIIKDIAAVGADHALAIVALGDAAHRGAARGWDIVRHRRHRPRSARNLGPAPRGRRTQKITPRHLGRSNCSLRAAIIGTGSERGKIACKAGPAR